MFESVETNDKTLLIALQLFKENDFQKAKSKFQSRLDIAEDNDEHEIQLLCFAGLANVALSQQELKEAKMCLEKAKIQFQMLKKDEKISDQKFRLWTERFQALKSEIKKLENTLSESSSSQSHRTLDAASSSKQENSSGSNTPFNPNTAHNAKKKTKNALEDTKRNNKKESDGESSSSLSETPEKTKRMECVYNLMYKKSEPDFNGKKRGFYLYRTENPEAIHVLVIHNSNTRKTLDLTSLAKDDQEHQKILYDIKWPEEKDVEVKLDDKLIEFITSHYKRSQRAELLQSPPFLSAHELIIHYNEVFDKSREEKQQPEMEERLRVLHDTIEKVIECIDRKQSYTIQQTMGLMSCHNPEIVKALIEKLLGEIVEGQLNFPLLYHALGQGIEQELTKPTLSADDQTQTAIHITERLEQVHAADLSLSCIMLYSLYQTLALMLHNKRVGQLAKEQHKNRIQNAIESFEKRLEAVKVQEDEPGKRAALADIREALTFSKHALHHISDHRSVTTQRIDQLKIAASLLLQATETSAAIGGAVATGGVTSLSAASSCYTLLSGIYHIGHRVRKDYQADKDYLTTLNAWQNQWWAIVEETADTPKNQEQLLLQQLKLLQNPESNQALKVDEKTRKAYQHPLFIRAIVNYLRVLYSEPTTTDVIRNEMMSVLRNYYILAKKAVVEKEHLSQDKKEKGKGKEKEKREQEDSSSVLTLKSAKQDVRENAQHIANVLLMMEQKRDEMTPEDMSFIDPHHRKVFADMQSTSTIPSETPIKLVSKRWNDNYPGDIDLYHSLTDENFAPRARFAVVAALQSTEKSQRKLSFWGEALLATYPKAEIQATAQKVGSKYIAKSLKIAGDLIVADKGREFGFTFHNIEITPSPFFAKLMQDTIKHGQRTSDRAQVTDESNPENALKPWYADFAKNIEVDGNAKRFRDYCRIDYEYGEKKSEEDLKNQVKP